MLCYNTMIKLNRNYMVLLAALLFATSAAFDPLTHDFIEGASSELECQFCNIEVSDPVQLNIYFAENFLFDFLAIEKKEFFLHQSFNNFQSRAPPIYEA